MGEGHAGLQLWDKEMLINDPFIFNKMSVSPAFYLGCLSHCWSISLLFILRIQVLCSTCSLQTFPPLWGLSSCVSNDAFWEEAFNSRSWIVPFMLYQSRSKKYLPIPRSQNFSCRNSAILSSDVWAASTPLVTVNSEIWQRKPPTRCFFSKVVLGIWSSLCFRRHISQHLNFDKAPCWDSSRDCVYTLGQAHHRESPSQQYWLFQSMNIGYLSIYMRLQ